MMRQLHLKTAVVAVSAMMLGACGGSENGKLQEQVDSLQAKVEQQGEELGFYRDCVDMMTHGLDSLTVSEGLLLTNPDGGDMASKDVIQQRLDNMSAALQANRARVAELEKRLSSSAKQVAGLKEMVSYLKGQLQQRDQQIADLQRMVSQQNFDITMFKSEVNRMASVNQRLNEDIAQKEEQLATLDEEANQAFYIYGSGDELVKKGILESTGLFNLGKKKLDVDDMDKTLFSPIDRRNITKINIPGKKVKVMTQHPASSYTITTDKKAKVSVLDISDPETFWSLSRYLVIKTD